uniref:Uncharacterized protein n=1 Tax=Zea mays TaxID=4577 RepID=B6U0A4_MAIZE|nr:hypothetical protein [Zea mays]
MAAAQPKPAKRLGGMAEALAIAADLGFPASTTQEDQTSSDKSDDLVKEGSHVFRLSSSS